MVSMSTLNYSTVEPRDNQMHSLVDKRLSMLHLFSGQISCCLLKCWMLLVEGKETCPMWSCRTPFFIIVAMDCLFISFIVDIICVHTRCYLFQRKCGLALHRDVQNRNYVLIMLYFQIVIGLLSIQSVAKANITCAKTSHHSE